MWIHVTAFDFAKDDLNFLELRTASDCVRLADGARINFRLTQPFAYLVNYRLFGLNATTLHWSSLVLHVCNGLLLFGIASRILVSHRAAFVCVLLWGVLPGNAVSIAWIVNHVDLLCAFFSFSCVLLLLMAAGAVRVSIRRGCYALAFISYALAVLSKENALPLVLCVLVMATRYYGSLRVALCRVAPFFIPPVSYVLYISMRGVNFLAQNPPGSSFPTLSLPGQIAVKLFHYAEAQALLIVPIPAFPSSSWAVAYIIFLTILVWVTWMRRGLTGHWQLLGDLAICTAIMMIPAAATSSLRIFYVPSAAFALTVVCGVMNCLGAARVQHKALAACCAFSILALLYGMGRRISQNFSPSADTVRAELCAKLQEAKDRDRTVADRLNQMCDRTDCCGPMRAGGPTNVYLNHYYEDRIAWVRRFLKQ
jgi:hypothetical protein